MVLPLKDIVPHRHPRSVSKSNQLIGVHLPEDVIPSNEGPADEIRVQRFVGLCVIPEPGCTRYTDSFALLLRRRPLDAPPFPDFVSSRDHGIGAMLRRGATAFLKVVERNGDHRLNHADSLLAPALMLRIPMRPLAKLGL